MTRNEAKLAGLTQYESGIPCPRGHLGPRYAASGNCVACHADRARAPKPPPPTVPPEVVVLRNVRVPRKHLHTFNLLVHEFMRAEGLLSSP